MIRLGVPVIGLVLILDQISKLIAYDALWNPLRRVELLSFLDLLGCFNFLKPFASICLILSLVTENCCPTSSSV